MLLGLEFRMLGLRVRVERFGDSRLWVSGCCICGLGFGFDLPAMIFGASAFARHFQNNERFPQGSKYRIIISLPKTSTIITIILNLRT